MNKYDKIICMNCGEKLDAHTDVEGGDDESSPQVGDFSICFYCGDIGVHVEDIETKNIFIKSAEKSEMDAVRDEYPDVFEMMMNAQKRILEK